MSDSRSAVIGNRSSTRRRAVRGALTLSLHPAHPGHIAGADTPGTDAKRAPHPVRRGPRPPGGRSRVAGRAGRRHALGRGRERRRDRAGARCRDRSRRRRPGRDRRPEPRRRQRPRRLGRPVPPPGRARHVRLQGPQHHVPADRRRLQGDGEGVGHLDLGRRPRRRVPRRRGGRRLLDGRRGLQARAGNLPAAAGRGAADQDRRVPATGALGRPPPAPAAPTRGEGARPERAAPGRRADFSGTNALMADGQQTILVVEDEASIASFVSLYLKNAGYAVRAVTTGNAAIQYAASEQPALIILDLMLPDVDGIEVCQRIRKASDVPILMLTARDEDVDKIVGLEVGADDYLTKPFNPRELVARVKSVLRRSAPERRKSDSEELRHGDLAINAGKREVHVGDDEIRLAPKEFDLLWELLDHRGIVLTRDQLLERVWGYTFAGDTRTVDVHVRQIRRKLGDASPIVTVWGVGYKVASERSPAPAA